MATKGNKVDLATFMKWGKDGIIGYKTINEGQRVCVNFVWCKVCQRNENALFQHPNCKGPVKKSVKSYIEGTNFVSKHTVNRHLESEGHRIAVQIESMRPASERVISQPSDGKVILLSIVTYLHFVEKVLN